MNFISAKDIYTNVWAMKTCGGVRDARSLALKSSCAAKVLIKHQLRWCSLIYLSCKIILNPFAAIFWL